jgi:diketogulonate reductase-like aldo/keto reductase
MSCNTAAIALARIHSRPSITSTLIGARRIEHLSATLEALNINLPPDHVAELDAVSKPTLNFPAENSRSLAPRLAFAGAMVDGISTNALPMIVDSPARY